MVRHRGEVYRVVIIRSSDISPDPSTLQVQKVRRAGSGRIYTSTVNAIRNTMVDCETRSFILLANAEKSSHNQSRRRSFSYPRLACVGR